MIQPLDVRTFREEVAEAFLRGFTLATEDFDDNDMIVASRGGPEKIREMILRKANQYATMRVLTHKDKLEPMK